MKPPKQRCWFCGAVESTRPVCPLTLIVTATELNIQLKPFYLQLVEMNFSYTLRSI